MTTIIASVLVLVWFLSFIICINEWENYSSDEKMAVVVSAGFAPIMFWGSSVIGRIFVH
jgi:hypothetical protein